RVPQPRVPAGAQPGTQRDERVLAPGEDLARELRVDRHLGLDLRAGVASDGLGGAFGGEEGAPVLGTEPQRGACAAPRPAVGVEDVVHLARVPDHRAAERADEAIVGLRADETALELDLTVCGHGAVPLSGPPRQDFDAVLLAGGRSLFSVSMILSCVSLC